jgi:hypothetical protein
MIDTIMLKIKHPEFKVIRPEYFSPRANYNQNSSIGADVKRKDVYKVFIQNASDDDKRDKIYKPSISIIQKMHTDIRELEWFLNIQFSVPKLIYGSNLNEITEGMFDHVVKILESKLYAMGIDIDTPSLKKSIVKRIHFGKNIELPPEYSISQVMGLIQKANTKCLKDRQVYYENGGEALHLYTKSHGIVFYDKLKDLERTKVSSIDKDRTRNERLQGKILRNSALQVLRFEVRYNGQQTVSGKVCKQLKVSYREILFPDVFNQKLWEVVLNSEWLAVTNSDGAKLALKFEAEPKEAIRAMLLHFGGRKRNVHSLNQVLSSYGIFTGIQNIGVNPLRSMFEQQFSHKTVRTRLDEKIKEIALVLEKIPTNSGISYIDSQIQECKQLSTYQIYD